MSGAVSMIELPFLAAFLIFALRFYGHDGATSIFAPSFLLATLAMLLALSFLALGVFMTVPAYCIYGFAAAGIALLAFAITRVLGF